MPGLLPELLPHEKGLRTVTLIGYARADPGDEATLADRMADLRAEGCAEVYSDACPGFPNEGDGLIAALLRLEPGDTLMVTDANGFTESPRQVAFILNWAEGRSVIVTGLRGVAMDLYADAAYAEHEREARPPRAADDAWRERLEAVSQVAGPRERLVAEITDLEARKAEAQYTLDNFDDIWESDGLPGRDQAMAALRKGISSFDAPLAARRDELADLDAARGIIEG